MLSRRAARLRAEPPLNRTLRRVLAGATNARFAVRKHPVNITKDPKAKLFSRTEIVSEKLCDDLIAYLAPTLKQYKGCTILDVHPGACLWSKKLHAFLKPKCHILMEPDGLYTEEFIKPLLQKPNSKYQHFKQPFYDPVMLTYSHPYAQALEFARKKGFRDIPTLSTSTRDYEDLKLRLIDSKLLMTGNLARVYPKGSPIGVFHREVLGALDNTSIHRNGLVRQLWWLPDTPKNKVGICPQVVTGRSSGNVMLALAADITEVAGVKLSTKVARERPAEETRLHSSIRIRNLDISADNTRTVRARMQTANMRVPKGRKLLQHPGPTESEAERDVELKSPFKITHFTVKEVDKAITDFDRYLDSIRAISTDWSKIPAGPSALEPLLENLSYPQSISAASYNAPTIHHSIGLTLLTQKKAIYLDTMLRMINLETHVVVLREQKHDISTLQSRLRSLDLEISGKVMKSLVPHCVQLVEDQLLHFSNPPNFLYDRRKFDPLLASPSDFWPPTALALYDCVPSNRDLDIEDIAPRSEVLKLARQLSRLIWTMRSSPLPVALDRVAPNAAQDLIPKVPKLTDPRCGGRLDARNLVTKMVGEEMFEGLVRAWFEWPFRPDKYDLEIEAAQGTSLPRGAKLPEVSGGRN